MAGLFDQVVNYSPPLLTAGQVNYDGTWNASTNTPTLINPPDALSKGDYYVVSVAGTQFSISFAVGDWIISNGTAWEKVDLTDSVSSVFGRTGAVVGVSTDYSGVGITNTAVGAANPSTGAFTSLSSSSTTTLNGTTVPASKTLVVTTDKLSALAATTSAELAGVISDETGSGALVFANSPTLVTPALGTPSALVGTNITGTAAAFNVNGTVGATTPSTGAFTSVAALSDSGYQAVVGQLTTGDRVGISGQASGSGTALVFFDNAQTTFRPAIFDASSHSLKISGVEKAAVTSTGLQGAIGATTPSTGAFTTVSASTPIAVASGGTGVTTSTGTTNVVLSNSPTLVTPILGTPQSGTLTSCTGLPISTGVSGLGTGVATFLGTPSSANLASAVTDETGSGSLVFATSPTLVTPNIGVATGTSLAAALNGSLGATTPSTIAATTLAATRGSSGTVLNLLSGNSANYVDISIGRTAQEWFFGLSAAANNYATGTVAGDLVLGASGAANLFFGINNSVVGKLTSTGLNSTAIGATTASTGSFTTLAATDDTTVTTSSASIKGFYINNATHGAVLGVNNAGLIRVGSTTNTNVSLVHNGDVKGLISSTGLAVTGALSSTNGATFLIDNAAGASPAVLRNSNSANNTTKSSSVLFQGTDTVGTVKNIGSIGFFPNDANYVSANLRFLVRSGDADPIERMRIDGSGNVGIGTASPAVKLHLDTATSGLTEILRLNRSTDAADNGVMIAFKQNAFNLAYIGSIREGAAGSDSLVFGTRADWGTGSPSEKMRITSLGNVGINTTSPSGGRLVVAQANSVQPAIHLPTDESTIQGPNADTQIKMGGNLVLQSGNETYVSAKNASGKILFSTGATPTERARIDSSGNLLVGTTSAGGKLVVTQGASSTNAILVDIASSTTKFAEFTFTGSNVGSISYNGTNTVYSTTSDYRLKDITGPLVDSGSFIDALKPKVGTWKSNGSKFVGFLAHEFAEVSPSSVCGEMDAVDSDGKPVHQTMQAGTAEVIANLVAELQSVRARLAVLESS